jgi:phosphomannomutase
MKPLLLFDVDGTIAESGEKVENSLMKVFEQLVNHYDLGIVGGGKYEKIIDQLNDSKLFIHIFSECGCVYHKLNENNGTYDLIYKENIRLHPLYNDINKLIKVALNFLSKVNYTLTGNFIDLRNGIIYISLIGMVANNEERKYFMKLDKEENIRKKLIKLLHVKSIELNISENVKILEGGSVGIGIYPIEYGKKQVLNSLLEYTNISYFGDKYSKDGNDYELIMNNKVNGFPIDSVNETEKILEEYFLHINC